RNPLLLPYSVWSSFLGIATTVNTIRWLHGHWVQAPRDVLLLASLTAAPLLPIIGFHLNQARRRFRAGYSLADLRAALDVGRRERRENALLARDEQEAPSHGLLRLATVGSATWLATTFGLVIQGTINEHRNSIVWVLAPIGTTMLLGAVSNALGVQFIPDRIR